MSTEMCTAKEQPPTLLGGLQLTSPRSAMENSGGRSLTMMSTRWNTGVTLSCLRTGLFFLFQALSGLLVDTPGLFLGVDFSLRVSMGHRSL